MGSKILRWMGRLLRGPADLPSGRLIAGIDPDHLAWPDLIRLVQKVYGLSTIDLSALMGKSAATIRTYKSYKVNREPPESFKEAFYKLLRCLDTAPAEVLLTIDGRQGAFKGADHKWHAVALGTGVFLHQCLTCHTFFVAQVNAKRCPTCREPILRSENE